MITDETKVVFEYFLFLFFLDEFMFGDELHSRGVCSRLVTEETGGKGSCYENLVESSYSRALGM